MASFYLLRLIFLSLLHLHLYKPSILRPDLNHPYQPYLRGVSPVSHNALISKMQTAKPYCSLCGLQYHWEFESDLTR